MQNETVQLQNCHPVQFSGFILLFTYTHYREWDDVHQSKIDDVENLRIVLGSVHGANSFVDGSFDNRRDGVAPKELR